MNRQAIGIMLAGVGVMLLGLRHGANSVKHHNFIDPGVDPEASKLMLKLREVHGVTGSFYLGRVPGNGYTDRLHQHGARSAFYYIPKHFDPSKPFELIFFFHGLTGYFKNTDGRYEHRVTMAIKEMDDSGRNYVLVFPEMVWSHFTSTPWKGRQRVVYDGSDQENFRTFYAESMKILRDHFQLKAKPYRTVMIGHSAGGSTLRAISAAGMMDEIKPELVVWSDSAYGSWLDEFHRDFSDQSNTKVVVYNLVDSSPTKPHMLTQRFLRSIGGKPSNYEIIELTYGNNWTHKKIGNNVLQMSADL